MKAHHWDIATDTCRDCGRTRASAVADPVGIPCMGVPGTEPVDPMDRAPEPGDPDTLSMYEASFQYAEDGNGRGQLIIEGPVALVTAYTRVIEAILAVQSTVSIWGTERRDGRDD